MRNEQDSSAEQTEAVTYPYASGDLLENRNTYFYSPYAGAPFLDAWRSQRATVMAEPQPNASLESNTESISAVEHLLASIGADLAIHGTSSPLLATLDHLVQRFEVTKRLHGEYNANWRPVNPEDYRSLQRYVSFAELLEAAYVATQALPYLNTLLKCVDTLSALRETLTSSQAGRLRALVAREQAHIAQLAASLSGAVHAS